MSGPFEAHRRYLLALREACGARPEVHRYQLGAIERELNRARLDGTQFEVTRCEYLDRAANAARVASITGDVCGARAAAIEFESCAKAAGYCDWLECLTAGAGQAAAARGNGHAAISAFTALILSVIRLRGEFRPAYRGQVYYDATDAAATLIRADPEFGWSKPRYALRLPWTGTALALLKTWVALPDSVEPDPVPPDMRFEFPPLVDSGVEAGPADAAAPYRYIADSPQFPMLTRAIAAEMVAEASTAATPQEAAAMFVTSGLLTRFAAAPWRVAGEAAFERRRRWPDPLIEHHWRSLIASLDRARTPAEVELVAAHASACFAVEADWNVLMFSSLVAPLRAACIAGWDTSSEAAQGLAGAASLTRELAGLKARDVERIPLADSFIRNVMTPIAADPDPKWGAYLGEPGCDLATEARVLAGAGGLRPFEELLRGVGLMPSAELPFELWKTPIRAARLHVELAKPRRPPIPGL